MAQPFAGVTFLNHSCIAVSSGETTILCDPWFTGPAFGDGWRLLCEDSHEIETLDFDYLWISHEHPDHFSIPTLRRLRDGAKIVYQKTKDQKVKRYLADRHLVIEMEDLERRRIGDIETQLFLCDGYDSAMSFELPTGQKVLNLNDIRVERNGLSRKIAEQTGEVDLLAMQFSYANWAGNPGDAQIPRLQHQQVVARIRQVCAAVKPKALLLFASYVYFSHEENFFWNQHFWLKDVVRSLGDEIPIIVPTPNTRIDLASPPAGGYGEQNARAIEFWTERHDTRVPVDKAKQTKSLDELKAGFQAFLTELWTHNDRAFAQATCRAPLDLVVHLSDLGETVRLDLLSGEVRTEARELFDVEVSSEILATLFASKFGRGSTTINGRIQFNYPTAHKFFAFFFVYYANNIGRYLKPGDLAWHDLRSIERTAVLESILHVDPEARRRYDEYVGALAD